jgi:hypothetical protein
LCPDACDDTNLCAESECIEGQGGNGCIYREKDCSDGDACTENTCDPNLGCQVIRQVRCPNGNTCMNNSCITNVTCDPAACDDENVNYQVDVGSYCNDNNSCTIDTCEPEVGCVYLPINCDDGDTCTDDTCNSILGCQYPVKDCGEDPEINALIGDCYVALCSNERGGCYLEQIPGTKVDQCGVCNGDGSTCSKYILFT